MQRVVRLSLAGLLAFAGAAVTACGDKVTLPAPAAVDSSIHTVTVAPPAASVAVGSSTQLAASVNAGSGATVRTVVWSSSDATIASVDQTGKVTGVKGGSATIIAKATADPSVSGASAITVTGGGVPTVTISSINQTVAGNSAPANLGNAFGQLDITLNVEPNGQVINTVTATITCGAKSLSASQTVSNLAPVSAEASAVPITLSINTAAFSSTTGAVSLNNGSCTLSAKVTTGTGQQVATNSTALTLNNTDVLIVKTNNSGASATDANGQPWKAGNITVAVTPVLYSGRSVGTVSITLPGAAGPTQTVSTGVSGVFSASWSATATTGSNVTQLTLTGGIVNGLPVGVHPTVTLIDTQGVDFGALAQANVTTDSDLRIDNQSPAAPTLANLSAAAIANQNWVTASYTFTGTGKYVSGGDNGGVNSSTTAAFFAATGTGAPTPLPVGTNNQLTGTGATACTTTGFAAVATGADIPNSTLTTFNTAYTVRILETDKLGNIRCTDLSNGPAVSPVAPTLTKFGVDKSPPVASITTTSPANLAVSKTLAGLANSGNFTVTFSDSLSGFSATPFLVTQTRQDATAAAACLAPSTVVSGVCTPTATAAAPIAADAATGTNGYFTTSVKVADQAGNLTDLGSRTVLIDNVAPTPVGGVALPANITANSAQGFSSAFTDNLDLISGEGSIVYTPMTLFFAGTMTPAGLTFDNVLTLSGSAALTIPAFIIDLQQVDAGAAPTAAGVKPTSVNVRAVDGAGNFAANNALIPIANVATAIATEFTTTNFQTFQVSNAAANIKNGTSTANTFPTSVVLTATITGSVSTQANPFTQVCFYYQVTAPATASNLNEWVQIGCQTLPAVTDVTLPAPLRTWTYGAVTFDPPAGLGTSGLVNIRAIGQNNLTGNAISTNTNAFITLNP